MKTVKIARCLLLAIGLLSASFSSASQDTLTLSGKWKFLRADVGSTWELIRPGRAGQGESFPKWSSVSLPHCYNATDALDPDVDYYEGPGWYKTLLKVNNPYETGRTLLCFEGAGQTVDVYVGMQHVATHVGGYDAWKVDITAAVKEFLNSDHAKRFKGKIPLSVRCDNTRNAERIPSTLSDFNVYGGIYRPLHLVYVPEISIENLRITPVLDSSNKKGTLRVCGTVYHPKGTEKGMLTVDVLSPDGEKMFTQKVEVGPTETEWSVKEWSVKSPQLWSPDNPRLYTCRVRLNVGENCIEKTEKFGFRHFEFEEHGPFCLNGKRLLLRGTHRHEDHAGVGAAMTTEQTVKEMKMIKEMGANFIRLGHYQQSDLVLRLCDELGILVWEEIPWCRGGVGGEKYRSQAKRMLSNMITQHYNHPSVILWGMGNENDWPNDFETFEKTAIRSFMKELHELSHQLDDTRLTTIRRCSFCKDIVDVYSPSLWAGWYKGIFRDYKKYTENEQKAVKRFIHVEWGGDSHAGRHNEDIGMKATREGYDPKKYVAAWTAKKSEWTESYIVRLFDWHLKEQETMKTLTGTAFWTFKDFSTPIRPENPIPYVNQKGVVQRDLTPKESYYVFQSYWSRQPMLHIYGHDWPVRWGEKDEFREILVYSNQSKVELFVNGKSAGVRKRDAQNFPAAGLRWYVPLKEGTNTLVAHSKGKENVSDTIHFIYQTEKWGKPAAFETQLSHISDGVAELQVWIVDKNGVKCLDESRFVRFGITGDGTLVKNQGTVKGSSKIQVSNGRACIRINTKGKSCVSVAAEGLPTALVTL